MNPLSSSAPSHSPPYPTFPTSPTFPPVFPAPARPTLHGGELLVWVFEDRREAGRKLAHAMPPQPPNSVAVGLTRGGVPVAAELARLLHIPLDLCAVRKIGAPLNPELALGAVASGGIRVFNPDLVSALGMGAADLDAAARIQEAGVLKVEAACRDRWQALSLVDRPVLLVDDGVATGATLRAATAAVRARGASRVTIAAPVAPAQVLPELRKECDSLVVLMTPEPFLGVGACYRDFPQVQNKEVAFLLGEARERIRKEETQ